MTRIGGDLPNCIIASPEKKRFILLRTNGEVLNLPEGWVIWEDTLLDLERKAYNQIRTKSEALNELPEKIVQLRV